MIHRPSRPAAPLLLLALLAAPAAHAETLKIHPPLADLPRDRLAALAPLLRTADFAVLESDARGWEKQVTTIVFAKASPEAVRDVVIHPERYQRFVRNMQGTKVVKNPDGTFDHNWKLSYTVASFAGVNRYTLLPAAEGEVGDVEVTDPTGMSHYRWQFLPATTGGGTVCVVYGYTDERHSGGFIDKVLRQADTLEYGLAITTQLSIHRSMVAEAEKHPGTLPPYVPPAPGSPATSIRFLTDRGTLVVLRHQGGRLVEFSLTERVRASKDALLDELAHADRWRYVPSYTKVTAQPARDGLPIVEIEQSLPLMSWDTHFGVRAAGAGVDLFGLEGDLHGARMRFDVRPFHGGQGADTQELTLRAQLAYDKSSIVMRELYGLEPLFEDGVNVGLTFVLLRALKEQVEKKAALK